SYGYVYNGGPINASTYTRCVACSVSLTTGVLAAWSQAGGTYDDATNQTRRYNASNGIVTDSLTGIQWQQNASETAMNWTDALAYCANQTTGGLSGWRVPNVIELQTLIDFTNGIAPYVNKVVFPSMPASQFWSSTPDVGNAGNSWQVYFSSGNYGESYWNTVSTLDRVLCVRSCYPTPLVSRYTATSGEVTDSVTNLIWQQVSTGSTMNWTNAITHCTGLNLNSHTWRLPSVRELATLVDYSGGKSSLMMNPTVFSGEPANAFWSLSSLVGFPTNAWYVYFGLGLVDYGLVTLNSYVRCVR
ncbi:MAG: DUF1566 domain-containing protein, partial [Myxococcaceae bacterium]